MQKHRGSGGKAGLRQRGLRGLDYPVASTALFGGSRVPEGGSKDEGKGKPGFAELLAKY